jgi:hypothetical protein
MSKARQWERVRGGAPIYDTSAAAERNRNIVKSDAFIKACQNAGIPATTRQASKFSRGLGSAYKSRKIS